MDMNINWQLVLPLLAISVVVGTGFWKERSEARRTREENNRKIGQLIAIIDEAAVGTDEGSGMRIAQMRVREIFPHATRYKQEFLNGQSSQDTYFGDGASEERQQ